MAASTTSRTASTALTTSAVSTACSSNLPLHRGLTLDKVCQVVGHALQRAVGVRVSNNLSFPGVQHGSLDSLEKSRTFLPSATSSL
eukprot:scaffold91591_cov62-Attheya_sp.AAC.3